MARKSEAVITFDLWGKVKHIYPSMYECTKALHMSTERVKKLIGNGEFDYKSMCFFDYELTEDDFE